MSVLIRGMEMPKPKLADMATVYNAYVLVRPNGHAVIVVDNENGLDSTEYTLVPVPPHGALMDRGDFFATCPELVDGYKRITDDLVVIPAEEGET